MTQAIQGTFPVYYFDFKIGTKGLASVEADMVSIAEMESLGFGIEGGTEEWTPMTTRGWASAMMTGKKFSVEAKAKRCVGDAGNDYIAGIAWKDGLDCDTKASITFPDGSKLEFDCVVDVTNVGGGDSSNVAPLEFKLIGKGKPTYTATSTGE